MREPGHKFDDSIVMTYAQYFRTMFSRTVSMIRAFETAFGKEEVTTVLTEWSERIGQGMSPSGIESFEEFKDYWKKTLASDNWEKILTCEFEKESDSVLACKYTECLWAKTMKDMNAEDLGYILFCYPDFAMATAMHPHLMLERSRTLMQGDALCDHTYSWKS